MELHFFELLIHKLLILLIHIAFLTFLLVLHFDPGVLFMCEGTKEQEIDWRIGAASAAGYADVLQVYCGEARAEREAES